MPRRYRRRYSTRRPVKPVKYSNETYNVCARISFTANQQINSLMIPAITAQGMRKCKNFTLRIFWGNTAPLLWTLVYLPEGQSPSPMNRGVTVENQTIIAGSTYEPNQNVIMSGLVSGLQPETFRTRLARNLNAGDAIVLCMCLTDPTITTTDSEFSANLNYAITY